jgi:hypothetical protein
MATFGRIIKWIVLLPVLAAVVLLAVANSQPVTVHLNPFDTADPVLRVELALYQIGFLLFAIGALCGAFVTWNGQRRYRSRARREGQAAKIWQYRAQKAERADAPQSEAGALLAGPGSR